jgi:lysophospholipase L1-like esterase
MYDDIHPNTIGEKKMAGKWFAAIKKHLRKL